eukprot:1609604-Prorocentrum_lima.AAC.1
MTSSLVGSEMCIRDRFVVVWYPWWWWIAGMRLSVGWGCVVWCRRWYAAVSYTHLTLPTICSV